MEVKLHAQKVLHEPFEIFDGCNVLLKLLFHCVFITTTSTQVSQLNLQKISITGS